jgi:hypothetical protein
VPAERADDETSPPPQVAARARLLAAHLQPGAPVTASVAAR